VYAPSGHTPRGKEQLKGEQFGAAQDLPEPGNRISFPWLLDIPCWILDIQFEVLAGLDPAKCGWQTLCLETGVVMKRAMACSKAGL
jgi:hypothetical protein